MAELLRTWPLPVIVPVSDDLLTQWYADRSRPRFRVNFVASVDGSAGFPGDSGSLSGEADKRVFEVLRRVCDVVLVGAGTVRGEGYGPMRVSTDSVAWRVASGLPEHPVFAIVSARADLDPASRIFTEAPVRPVVVTAAAASVDPRLFEVADVEICGETEVEPELMVAALHRRGLRQVLCEGGPALFGSVLAAGVVDELFLTVSPQLIGGGGLGRIVAGSGSGQPMQLAGTLVSDHFLLLRYHR